MYAKSIREQFAGKLAAVSLLGRIIVGTADSAAGSWRVLFVFGRCFHVYAHNIINRKAGKANARYPCAPELRQSGRWKKKKGKNLPDPTDEPQNAFLQWLCGGVCNCYLRCFLDERVICLQKRQGVFFIYFFPPTNTVLFAFNFRVAPIFFHQRRRLQVNTEGPKTGENGVCPEFSVVLSIAFKYRVHVRLVFSSLCTHACTLQTERPAQN